ncbi:S-adenosyl-L-methionine-dependent methyltransferase [Xylaria acuta]|nr:S-adenosyl-L-methionine-dependent methyltransferase [Xylaria acuta]
MSSERFFPKQAVESDGALLKELQGDVTEAIAREVIKVVPQIKPGWVIHDNGCGYGSVTGEIIASSTPADIKIHSTDKSANNLAQLRAKLKENPTWPVTAEEMNASTLTFPDNFFDLSVTNFVLIGLGDDVGAAKHVLRTVKPGGTAVIGVWKETPWLQALKEAHRRTRSADAPLPLPLAVVGYNTEQLKRLLNEAGFKNTKYVEKPAWVNMPDLKRWSTIAWTYLCTPVGGWTQADEDTWDQAIDVCVQELQNCNAYDFKDGVHRVCMVATIAVTEKE